jgi:hypothetical protein
MSFTPREERPDHLKHEDTQELKQLVTLVMKDGLKWRETALKPTTHPSNLLT